MSIKYAILGFLSWTPLTGYDLKKLFSESETLYWSGNNNQIYRALVELHEEDLVTIEVQHQEDRPSRKIYTMTAKGQAELRRWVLSSPEPPQLRNPFLVQLAWADQLNADELDTLLAKYQEEISVKLLMLQEQTRRGTTAPDRTPREAFLWARIAENGMSFYERELDWVRTLRHDLAVY
jgi:DNA-binding PadR family transcriptional regulator